MRYSTLSEPEITFTADGRPKFQNLSLSAGEKVLNICSIIIHLAMWALIIRRINQLPDQIPSHVLPDGQPDHFISKYLLFLLPAVGLVGFVFLYILTWYPHMFILRRINVTVDNAPGLYVVTRIYIRILILILQSLLLIDVIIWLKRLDDNQPPGIVIGLIPTVGLVVLFVFATLLYNRNIDDELELQYRKHHPINEESNS